MPHVPTFDQITYQPDIGHRITVDQATALLARATPAAEVLAQRIAEVCERNQRMPDGLRMLTVVELVDQVDRCRRPDECWVGSVRWHHPMASNPMSHAVLYDYATDSVRAGLWSGQEWNGADELVAISCG